MNNNTLEREYRRDRFLSRQVFGLLILVFIIVLLLLTLGFVYFGFSINIPGRAATTGSLSLDNSYVFASPLSSCADGTSLIRVTVFLLSDQGLGVAGRTVGLEVPGGLSVSTVQGTTDTIGKAYFDVASFTAGSYTIFARVGESIIPQKVSLGFRDDPSCHL